MNFPCFIRHVIKIATFAGILKILPVFIFIIPGMIALALARTGDYSGLNAMVDAQGEVVRDIIGDRASCVWQKQRLGTGHAVLQAKKALKGFLKRVKMKMLVKKFL